MNLQDKGGFVENWSIFFVLTAVGIIISMVALKVWSAQEFDIGIGAKVGMFVMSPIAAAFFTRMWFD